jgi:hypothetical protein
MPLYKADEDHIMCGRLILTAGDNYKFSNMHQAHFIAFKALNLDW